MEQRCSQEQGGREGVHEKDVGVLRKKKECKRASCVLYVKAGHELRFSLGEVKGGPIGLG